MTPRLLSCKCGNRREAYSASHTSPFLLQHRTYSHLTRHNPSQNMSQNCTVQNQLLQKSMKAHENTIQYTNSILWKPRIGLLSPTLLPRHARSTPPSTGSRIPTRLHTAPAKEKELSFIEVVQALKITQEHCYVDWTGWGKIWNMKSPLNHVGFGKARRVS